MIAGRQPNTASPVAVDLPRSTKDDIEDYMTQQITLPEHRMMQAAFGEEYHAPHLRPFLPEDIEATVLRKDTTETYSGRFKKEALINQEALKEFETRKARKERKQELAETKTYRPNTFAITSHDVGHAAIGVVAIRMPQLGDRVWRNMLQEIHFVVNATHQRQGLGSSAVTEAIDLAFLDPTLNRILANSVANEGFATKLGFQKPRNSFIVNHIFRIFLGGKPGILTRENWEQRKATLRDFPFVIERLGKWGEQWDIEKQHQPERIVLSPLPDVGT
jgi:RimJ/RimL family protein N-acetyltransferase